MKTSSKVSLGIASLALVISLTACAPPSVTGLRGPVGPVGPTGAPGATGSAGAAGVAGGTGPQGAAGTAGEKGAAGATGASGAQGGTGANGQAGSVGPAGPTGAAGPMGPAGAAGATGSGVAAEFFALMPSDNPATVPGGTDVQFPQDGPSTSSDIVRLGPSMFDLVVPGIYRVSFQVPVTEPGQLVLTLDGFELAYTVVGRSTGTSQITLIALVQSVTANAVLTVRNPIGSPMALTISPFAGGLQPVSATLLIELVKAT
ncbi:MAG: Collagen triple helix repeat protein [Microbacteriaceae bacterium]|nr:Collagen triple helix repeat protein [Microbacteriaceae bacterium]